MKNQVPDILLHSAMGFNDIGFNSAFNMLKDNSVAGFQRAAPAAVNFLFASELLLKALIIITTKKTIKGHYLKSLFNQLPDNIQKKVEKQYYYHQEKEKDNKDLSSIKIVVSVKNSQDENNNKERTSNDLNTFLEIHNKGFENWRYLHEIGEKGYTYEADFKSIDCFNKAIGDVINSLPLKKRFYLKKT
jgi:hypothetical protein